MQATFRMQEPSPTQLTARQLDIAVIERMGNGDSEALALLYERHSSVLLALAIRILRDRQEAEDVLQEVFVQAWHSAERYDPGRSSVLSWLTMITRSRAIDRYRSRKTRQLADDSVRREAVDVFPAKGEDQTWQSELRRRLTEELSRIPLKQRETIELCYAEFVKQVPDRGRRNLLPTSFGFNWRCHA